MSAALILGTLGADFRPKVERVIALAAAQGIGLVPYFGARSIEDQARLWRRSRSDNEALEAVAMLNSAGASRLAAALVSVGPQQPGPWATNALPGASWHQFGQACDLYVERAGKACWNTADLGYAVLRDAAQAVGLTSGAGWKKPDPDHIQASSYASPLDSMSWAEIDARMTNLIQSGDTKWQ